MAFGWRFVPDFGNAPVRTDQKRGAHDSHETTCRGIASFAARHKASMALNSGSLSNEKFRLYLAANLA